MNVWYKHIFGDATHNSLNFAKQNIHTHTLQVFACATASVCTFHSQIVILMGFYYAFVAIAAVAAALFSALLLPLILKISKFTGNS